MRIPHLNGCFAQVHIVSLLLLTAIPEIMTLLYSVKWTGFSVSLIPELYSWMLEIIKPEVQTKLQWGLVWY